MPTLVNGVQHHSGENPQQVRKRIFEAEKVVMSSMLHRWHQEFGVDYLIVVIEPRRGSEKRVFLRWKGAWESLYAAVEKTFSSLLHFSVEK